VAYLETEIPQLQVRFSCSSGVSLRTEKFGSSEHQSRCMPSLFAELSVERDLLPENIN